MYIDINVRGNAEKNLNKIQFATSKADAETKRYKQTIERLEYQQKNLQAQLSQTTNSISNQSNKLQSSSRAMREHHTAISSISRNLGIMAVAYKTATVASAILRQSINDFSDLEEKTLEVAKTTGLAGDKLNELTEALKTTSQNVRGMQLDNLYKISAVAGQLGVKGKDDILQFSIAIQKLVKTSKLTAEEASEGFAQLANSLNEPIKNIDKLASTFTILASNTTASESVLLDYTQRLAGAGKTLGLTTAQIAGIGATLKDVGISAEVGGTAISDVFLKIITKGDKFARRLGIDMQTFSDAVNNEPIKAVNLFIQALGRMDKKAKTKALDDLKLSGSGLSSTLLKLSTNTDKLSKNIAIANKGYASATEHSKEFEIATRGLATTQQQFRDQLKITSAELGSKFAPTVDHAYRITIQLLKAINLVLDKKFDVAQGFKDMKALEAQQKITNNLKRQAQLRKQIAISEKTINDISKGSLNGKVSSENITKILTAHGQAYNKAKIELDALNKTIKKIPKKKKIVIDVQAKNKTSISSLPQPTTTSIKSPWVTPIIPQTKEKQKIEREIIREQKIARKEDIEAQKRINRERVQAQKEAKREVVRQQEEISLIAKRREEEHLRNLKSFQVTYDEALLSPLEFNMKKLNQQKEEFIKNGMDSLKIQEWYSAKTKEILINEDRRLKIIEDEHKRKKKYLEDEVKQKIRADKKAKKEATKLTDEFINTLQNSLQNIGKNILNDYAKNGSVVKSVNQNIDNGQLSDALISSGNPYAMGVGALSKIISGSLTSSIDLVVNKGSNSKAIERSLDAISNINNKTLDFNKQIADNTKAMVQGFNNIGKKGFSAKGLTGTEFTPKVSTLFGGGDNIISGIGSALSHTTTTLLNSGIKFESVLAENADRIVGNGFQRIKTETSSLFGLIKSGKEKLVDTGAISEDLRSLVGEVLSNGVNNIISSANELGIKGSTELINRVEIELGNIDIKGKTEEEITALFQGVIGNALDNVSQQSLGSTIDPFRQSGEDYYSTLIRISTGFADATESLKRSGIKAIDSIKDIANKTGDVYAETIRESLLYSLGREEISIDVPSIKFNRNGNIEWVTRQYSEVVDTHLSGIGEIIKGYEGSGEEILKIYSQLLDTQNVLREIRDNNMSEQVTQNLLDSFKSPEELSTLQNSFYENFVSDAKKQADIKARLDSAIGDSLPTTKEGYLRLVQSINLSTQSGRNRYALLLREQNEFIKYVDLRDKALEDEKKKVNELKDKWKETFIQIKDSLRGTIDNLRDGTKKDNPNARLVQDIVNYNQIKKDLQNELRRANPNSKEISYLTNRLNSTAISAGSNGDDRLKYTIANDLELLRNSLPKNNTQKVEVVNSSDGETLNLILDKIGASNNIDDNSRKTLQKILEELQVRN